jgi:hypothetical protein
MKHAARFIVVLALAAARPSLGDDPKPGASPADHLPPHITQLTTFGERADWSHDGKKILFMSKTFGDAMEINVETKVIRNLTAHFAHYGFVRAMYLANDDILLTGPETFDPRKIDFARRHCFLYVLDKNLTKAAMPLGEFCSEGPAVSRSRMHIAWTQWSESDDKNPPTNSVIYEGDIVYQGGVPKIEHKKFVMDRHALPFPCTIETQSFRPPAETQLTFTAYSPMGDKADVCSVDLATGKVTNHTASPDDYDEAEGISPDGSYELIECDKQNHGGPGHIDIWKLNLGDARDYRRLTFFSEYPGYKSSNPVVSDDGRFFAFQAGKANEATGSGHGIFIYDFKKANEKFDHSR